MKDKFVRLGVSFARKHADRTKIWTPSRSNIWNEKNQGCSKGVVAWMRGNSAGRRHIRFHVK